MDLTIQGNSDVASNTYGSEMKEKGTLFPVIEPE